MPDPVEDKLVTTAMAPVQIMAIGTGTGTGGPKEQLVETPEGQPDVLVRYITPLVAILVSAAYTFLTVLVPTVSAGMTTNLIPATDFMDLLGKCASLSVAGAGLDILKNLITLFTTLKQKFPILGAT